MPASLQQPTSLGGQDMMASPSAGSTSGNATTTLDSFQETRTVKLALELAMLQGGLAAASDHHHHHHHSGSNGGFSGSSSGTNGGLGGSSDPIHHNMLSGSLEDLKTRRSQNMTECVPVPSSEHVAEIVGRQGCKIKALRAKTNTYIKTPVRGEEPVFVVTGRKEDVALAKREILSAADHFSQIRATRKNNINSTLAFGQLMANTPGQTTEHVRVPYRVVGLVVGPKGATIKRIQQQTHTYIVTPSRDKEPVFEVTGLPENVDAAKKEIEAHIALRTGNGTYFADGSEFIDDNFGGSSSAFSSSSSGGPHLDHPGGKFNSILSSSSGGGPRPDSFGVDGGGGGGGAFISKSGLSRNLTLQHLLDSSNNLDRALGPWSTGTDSHDSGIGHSPPFDSTLASTGPILEASSGSLNGIWGELNKALGNLDLDHSTTTTTTNHLFATRSSLDLGSLGSLGPAGGPLGGTRPSIDLGTLNSTANNTFSNNSSSSSPPTSLPFGGVPGGGASPLGSEKTSPFEAALASVSGSEDVIHEKIAFSSVSDKPLSAAGDFISFANK